MHRAIVPTPAAGASYAPLIGWPVPYDARVRTIAIGALAAALCGAACGKSDQDSPRRVPPASSESPPPPRRSRTIEIPSQLSAPERAAAERARDAFVAACAPIEWSDFQEVSLTTSMAAGYLKDRYDWELMVTVALTYKEGLDQRRGGHRLTFEMGAGRRPGIVTSKSHAIRLCASPDERRVSPQGRHAGRTRKRTASSMCPT